MWNREQTTVAEPPPELSTGPRTYPCAVLPFGESASQLHDEHPGRRYSWSEIHLPRRDVPLTEGHDGPEIGFGSGFVKTREALWCSLKVGARGEELIGRGHRGVSPEITEDGDVIALALVVLGMPAFSSATVYIDGLRSQRRGPVGGVVLDGVVQVGPGTRYEPAQATRSAMDLGEHRRELATFSMTAVHEEVETARRRWEDRKAALATADVEEEEQRLVARGVPMSLWPVGTRGRQSWDTRQAYLAAQDALEYEGRRWAQHLELQLAAAAVRPRRPWWRRWRWWK